MSETPHSETALWRRPDRLADALVLLSWLAVIGMALLLLRPAIAAIVPQIETVSIAAAPARAANLPEFYPWVRPAPVNVPEGIAPWSPAVKPQTGGFFTRLDAPLQDKIFAASDHDNTDSFYGGDWVPENIGARDGGAFLEVRRIRNETLPYSAAEMQTSGKHHYGRYETIMQPARGSGLVTAFFTYTGQWFGGDPHDEIDIEFLGSDTTKVHFNYFRKGKSIKPATFDLPFDAASKPHLYAYEWRPDGITWFVEGVPVYATEAGDPGIPVAAGKVMFSAWTGKPMMEGWHGKPLFRDGSGAQFNCVSFTPLGHDTPKCSDTYTPGGGARATGAR